MVLHVAGVPREREPDRPCGLWSHRMRACPTMRALAPPDARPPLQSPTLCALVPPPIRNGAVRTCHLLGQWGTS